MDESWVHYYTARYQTAVQSKQSVEAGASAPKEVKSIASAGKAMAMASLLVQLDAKIR